MKKFYLIAVTVLSFFTLPALAQKVTQDSVMQVVSNGKPYSLVILRATSKVNPDNAAVQKMQMDHLVNLFQMERDGKISIFGPINNDPIMRGIIIFYSTDKVAIAKDLGNDPYIKEGYLSFKIYDWFTIPGQKISH